MAGIRFTDLRHVRTAEVLGTQAFLLVEGDGG